MPYRVTEPGNHTIEANRIVAGTVHAKTTTEETEEVGETEEQEDGVQSGGGALPVLVLLLLIAVVLVLIAYARNRNRTDS